MNKLFKKLFHKQLLFDMGNETSKTVDLREMEAKEYLLKNMTKWQFAKFLFEKFMATLGLVGFVSVIAIVGFVSVKADDSGRYTGATLENILDDKIIRFCKADPLAYEETYSYKGRNMLNYERCSLIGMGQIRMETKSCSKGLGKTKNNCFGLKGKNNKFIHFSDKTKSIQHWVDRYYRLDYKKTIHTIVYGYWMKDKYGDGKYKWMFGYSTTDRPHYYKFVKKFFKDNYGNLNGQD